MALDSLEMVLQKVERIRSLITDLEEIVNQFKRLHQNELISVVASGKDAKDVEKDRLMSQIESTSSTIRTKLKEASKEINAELDLANKNKHPISTTLRIKATQHASLLHSFCEILGDYNSFQVEQQQHFKRRFENLVDIAGLNLSADQLQSAIENGKLSIFTDGAVLEMENTRQELQDVQEQYEEILKLENSLKEIKNLFWELVLMVDAQAETVSTIEKHAEASSGFVSGGTNKLKKAKKEKIKIRKRTMKIGALLGTVGLVVGTILILV